MTDDIDPLIDRLLQPNERLALEVRKLSTDMAEVRTKVESINSVVVSGHIIERIAKIETRMTIAFYAGGAALTAILGVAIQALRGQP